MASTPSITARHQRQYTSERELITESVRAGFSYAVIIHFLATFHDLPMSLRTFKNRLRAFNIQRRLAPTPLNAVRDCIKEQLETSVVNVGYRQMHQILKCRYNMQVSKKTVMELLRQLDPAASARRRRRAFRMRVYYSKGPVYVRQFL